MTRDPLTQPFDLSTAIVGLWRDGTTSLLEWKGGPPPRADGFTVGAPFMTSDPPHAGELHPDGDELLLVISGRVDVHLEEPTGERVVPLGAGEAFVVPRGTWHRVLLKEPTRMVHITPGPGGEHRPLRRAEGSGTSHL